MWFSFRSLSSEGAFQARRSSGSSCSDYSSLQSICSFDSTTQLFNLPMANFSSQNTPSYTSALNTTAMMEADSCTNSPLKSSSMPGLDRASLASFTPGLPLSSMHKRYDIGMLSSYLYLRILCLVDITTIFLKPPKIVSHGLAMRGGG